MKTTTTIERTHQKVRSPLGELVVVQDSGFIVAILQPLQLATVVNIGQYETIGNETSGVQVLRTMEEQLNEFFHNGRRHFDVPYQKTGTAFQLEVWEALQDVPYSTTTYYSDIADAIGKPSAVQAVGTAISKNLLPILVPCHRIIAKNGIINYSGGRENKLRLLEIEKGE